MIEKIPKQMNMNYFTCELQSKDRSHQLPRSCAIRLLEKEENSDWEKRRNVDTNSLYLW